MTLRVISGDILRIRNGSQHGGVGMAFDATRDGGFWTEYRVGLDTEK